MKSLSVIVSAVLTIAATSYCHGQWQPADGPLMTRWAKEVSPENAHAEYPRPQMVREKWMNLNGLWECTIASRQADRPETFDEQILVPFPIESALSGVMKKVGTDNRLWYRRTFKVPGDWSGGRVLLHFEAVDWEATAWLNGHELGSHRGGYDPFTFDITKALKAGEEQELVVAVWDPTNDGTQPRGKQVKEPKGIWYTSVTGIWQTVWLEPVPEVSIGALEIVPDVDASVLRLSVETSGAEKGDTIGATIKFSPHVEVGQAGPVGSRLGIELKEPKLWSPDSPHLYDLKVELRRGDQTLDAVTSYFGMRKISLGKDEDGITRMMLNGKFLFQYGPLDQGWWPDGLYTAPSDEALRYDLEMLKELGCNMLRKHVKVEPRRLYYWCDKLGLLVWQDMPSGDRYIRGNDPDLERSEESAKQFELEMGRVMDNLRNHPSIVMWVPFNEGWGQYDTGRIVDWIKNRDPSRLVNHASGWTDRGVGDVNDIHRYPGPGRPDPEEDRAIVLGEFGGLGLPMEGHTWQAEKNWGYRSYKTRDELTEAYLSLMHRLHPMIGEGLSAAVYTQTSDVEIEVNGMMTYDRAVVKMDAGRLAEAHRRLHGPPPVVSRLVATSQEEAQLWRYRTSEPDEGWERPDHDDSSWQEGPGGFGVKSTPGAIVRTEWKSPDIWLRRCFTLKDAEFDEPFLLVHHDEDAEVYVNGRLVGEFAGFTSDYGLMYVGDKLAAALEPGKNVLAVHCRQTRGGQYIDVGISDVKLK